MTQALHIFCKDLRRGWPLLLFWVCLLLLLSQPSFADPLDADQAPVEAGLALSFILIVAGMIGTALVIQSDSLVGESEMWMTIPIEPWSLIAAKTFFVGLFFVLPPAVLQLAASMHFGLPQSRWLGHFFDLALPWAAFLAIAALLAALTRGLAGLFSLMLALVVGPQIIFGIVRQISGQQGGSTIPNGFVSALGLVAAGLLVLQYLTRRRALIALTGLIAIPLAWIYPLEYRMNGVQPLEANLGRLTAAVAPDSGRETFAVIRADPNRPEIAAELRVETRVPSARRTWSLLIGARDAAIEWHDGGSSRAMLGGSWADSSDDPPIDGFAWADGHAPAPRTLSLSIQDEAPFEDFLGRRGRLAGTGRATILLRDGRVLALENRAELRRGGFAARVIDVRFEPPELEVRVRVRQLTRSSGFHVAPVPYLANRSRGEMLPLIAVEDGNSSMSPGLLLSGPWPSAQDYAWRADLSGIAASLSDWVAGAEAIVVFYDLAGYAEVSLQETEIVVDDEPAGPVYANEAEGLARPPLRVTVQ